MPEVRQSSFALLGDLTKACFLHVKPCICESSIYSLPNEIVVAVLILDPSSPECKRCSVSNLRVCVLQLSLCLFWG